MAEDSAEDGAENGASDEQDIDFWRGRYGDANTPWDLGAPSEPVQELVRAHFPTRGRVLIPGCGLGHEALFLAGLGYAVTAVDFIAAPLRILRAAAAERGLKMEILQQDMFALPTALDGSFDVFLEQTCLCAIAPAQWTDYEALARRMLKPGRHMKEPGGRLLGVFMEMEGEGGPPYDCPPEKVRALFGNAHWAFEGMAPQPKNPDRPGPEYTARFRRVEGEQ